MPMKRITRKDWTAFLQGIYEAGSPTRENLKRKISAKELGRVKCIVKGIIDHAEDEGIISYTSDEVISHVRTDMHGFRHSKHSAEDEVYYPDELQALKAYCLSNPDPYTRCILLAIITGERIGECAALLAEDIDLDDLSDEELSQMEDELENQEIDNIVGEPEQVDLDPEEEKVADDLMAVSATTELINNELNAEERAQFYESARDTQIAVYEGFLLESDIQDGREIDDDLFTESKMWRKTMVRFSKDDRKKQLYSVAVNVSARAHNDPLYFKYQKILKARKLYKRKLEKKYHAEAIKRMKVYFNRLKNSKSSVLANIGKKFSK